MKKLFGGLSLVIVLCLCGIAFYSCSNDDKNEPEMTSEKISFEDEYFGVEGGTYQPGEIPSDANGEPIDGLNMNDQALTGGMNFVTIQTEKRYEKFMLGVKGEEGYWEIDAAQASRSTRAGYFTYIIPINFGVNFNISIIIVIVAVDDDGNLTAPSEELITHVDSQWGDLNLNLTFSNAKDIDLHLYTPSGNHIYYGNRGGSYYNEESEEEYYYGLDHDSNAACYIDGLNNENIVIPAALIEPGIYTVKVDMYSNCDPSISTNWAIVARYMNQLITPIEGHNPASGVYEIGAPNSDHSFVMSFQLKEGNAENSIMSTYKHKALPLTESAKMKIEEITD